MRSFSTFLLLCAACLTLSAQDYNLELLANVDFTADNSERGNDVWGYVDSTGLEYAIVGSTAATYIYSLEDPGAPVLRKRIPGVSSPWRDIKDHLDHIYVVADQGSDGILSIDMALAPDSISFSNYNPSVTIGSSVSTVNRSHNLYITEDGYLILAGTNVYTGAPLFFDLNQSLDEPPFIGASRQVYAHDVFAENSRLYSSDIYKGEVTIHDYSDPGSIVPLGSASTTRVFTHNAWPTNDDSAVFTTDEKSGAFVDAFDVTAPGDIRFLDRFRPDESFDGQSIPHNTHVLGNHLATSWYRDGVILTDVTRPNNMVEVGRYDTYPNGSGGGFDGCWGAYPFLPSGLLLASDIQTGLYVFEPTYEQGCYFEGTVVDSITGQPISGASINFDGRSAQSTATNVGGDFATGIYAEGDYPVVVSHPGYLPQTFTVSLARGEVKLRDIKLRPEPTVNLTVSVTNAIGDTVPEAQFILEYLGDSPVGGGLDGVRKSSRESVKILTGLYNLTVGSWGFQTKQLPNLLFDDGETASITVTLDEGYYDDFLFDQGWTSSSSANTGDWERGLPIGTVYEERAAQLGYDVPFDFGGEAYVTANIAGDAGEGDVDAGTVELTSPIIDGTTLPAGAVLEFWYYFFNEGGNSDPDDSFIAKLSDGKGEEITLTVIDETTAGWTKFRSLPLADLIPLTDLMRVVFRTSDASSSGHLVEAMIDAFSITNSDAIVRELTLTNTRGCAPFETSATLSDVPMSSSIRWTFVDADQPVLRGDAVTASYSQAGTFDVYVTLTDSIGGISSQNFPAVIEVLPAVSASFRTEQAGDSIFFFNTSVGGTNAEWDFGDGTTSTELFTGHEYAEAGSYLVTLTASGECGSSTLADTVVYTVTSSVDELVGTASLTLLKNPVSQQLVVDKSSHESTNVILTDLLGRTVRSLVLPSQGRYSIDVGSLPVGLYYLQSLEAVHRTIPVVIAR